MLISRKYIARRWRGVPRLLRLLAINCAIGICAGWTLLATLILTDTAGLTTLICASDSPSVLVAMLAAGFAVTFGSAAMGVAVMQLRNGDAS
jgi:hypothetical protein